MLSDKLLLKYAKTNIFLSSKSEYNKEVFILKGFNKKTLQWEMSFLKGHGKVSKEDMHYYGFDNESLFKEGIEVDLYETLKNLTY